VASPYATGGGGIQFETSVAAYYLSALLCEHPARGVPGNILSSVKSQRADFEAPLDDLVISGIGEDGQTTGLHLQIKNKVSFTVNDENWVDVLGACPHNGTGRRNRRVIRSLDEQDVSRMDS
jgi:hypothetical protein